ncbi:MAG: PDZ domain-containing protein [Ignavibacteriales bacterium]|nr:PDZ domain-containing protein [Ignavibacteriales bacterium]
MKRYAALLAFLFISIVLGIQAQQIVRKLSKGGGVFNLPEIGGVILGDNGKVFFDMMMPADDRKAEYKSLDIKKDDVILMMNSKKITSIKEVEEMYNGAKPGDEVKFGLNRAGKNFLVSFKKGDPSQFQGMRTIIKTSDGAGKGISPIDEIGILAEEKEGKVFLTDILPFAPEALKNSGAKEQDVIVSINGTKTRSIKEVKKQLEKIGKGEKFTLGLQSGGKQKSISLKKEKPKGRTIIRKQK